MAYRFYTKRRNGNWPANMKFPCFGLIETSWNDFDYVTQFVLTYYENSRKKIEIGYVKILQKDKLITYIPARFTELREKFCSLGQDNNYYKSLLEKFTKEENLQILDALNDITYAKVIYNEFLDNPGLKTSLLRSSEAQKAFTESQQILFGKQTKNSFFFEFSTKIPSFAVEHSVKFEFTKSKQLPRRIAAIIGKNGSGKTQYLARLASSLSGLSERGKFNTDSLPPFSRVIAISYTLFDRFEKPRSSKSFSYFFCGFQSDREIDSFYGIQRRINRALSEIENSGQLKTLKSYIDELLGSEVSEAYFTKIHERKNNKLGIFFSPESYSEFSSGQIILLIILTEIVAYIRPESVLLFDEPETHLHPNAISKLVGVLYELLQKHDSFAIIATHSPLIVQEIPSRLIYYFDNDRSNPPVKPLSIESFGENLTTLTEQIFNTLDVDENYKKVIRKLFTNNTKEEIFELFNKEKLPLSMNAKLFIEYQDIINEESQSASKE